MAKVFISYRRADSATFAGRMYDRLVARLGQQNVFKDVDDIPLGAHFGAYIQTTLRQCSVVLVLIGAQWLDVQTSDGRRRLDDPTDWVRIELEQAFALGLTVIPLLIEETPMPAAANLPASLGNLTQVQAVRVRNDPDFGRDMERVLAAVEYARNTPRQRYQPSVETSTFGLSMRAGGITPAKGASRRSFSPLRLLAASCGTMIVQIVGLLTYTRPGEFPGAAILSGGDLLALGIWIATWPTAARSRVWQALLIAPPIGSLLVMVAIYNALPNRMQYVALEPPFVIACALAILFNFAGLFLKSDGAIRPESAD